MNIPKNIQSELQQLQQEGAVAKSMLVGMASVAAVDTIAYLGGRAMHMTDIPLGSCMIIAGVISGLISGYYAYQHEMQDSPSQ